MVAAAWPKSDSPDLLSRETWERGNSNSGASSIGRGTTLDCGTGVVAGLAGPLVTFFLLLLRWEWNHLAFQDHPKGDPGLLDLSSSEERELVGNNGAKQR